jgi:phosphomevalonate kinase
VSLLSSKRTQEWEAAHSASHISAALYETHKITELIRSHMRDMSGRTGVPIEPPEQTELLNACLDVPGVVGGGVPGGQFSFSFIEYSRH